MKDYADKGWLKSVKAKWRIATLNPLRRYRMQKAMRQIERQIEIDLAASRMLNKMQERAMEMGPKHALYYSVQRYSGASLRIGRDL